jgi:CHAT domain-containing protein/tetratricopeptide (TPR) repeat protein
VTASGCGQAQVDEAPRGLLGELAEELGAAPTITPRLSIYGRGAPCLPAEHPRATGYPSCTGGPGAGPSSRVAATATRARRAARDGADAQALHAMALIDLLYDGGAGKRLQQAISSLQSAARLADHPAPVLADLAAAYLVRAERAHAPRDLLAAIDAAEAALERQPGNRAARYNLALALERLELRDEAAREWRSYLAVDSASAWAREARRHLARVLAAPVEAPPPAPGAPLSAYAAYAAAEPQGARELGWCRVLGEWAGAVLGGDSAGAADRLGRAEALGAALERRAGGDATLADAVRALRSRGREPRRLAEAHRAFSAGCEREHRAEFGAAKEAFARAEGLAGGSPTLRTWARLLRGSAVFHEGDRRAGEVFREVAEGADSVHDPALAGCARQLLAAALLRGDGYEGGLEQATRARDLFVGAGERENQGVALQLQGIARGQMRDMDQAYALARLSLARLQLFPSSRRLHSTLLWLATVGANDGFLRAALRIQDEGVRVAERTGVDVYVAEAHLSRAQLFATAGDHPRARRDVAAAQAAVAHIEDPDPKVVKWMVARRQMAEAPTLIRTAPARAAGALDSAAAYFRDTMNTTLVAFPAIVAGAHARLAAGDGERGAARLESALRVLERRRDRIRMEPRRAAVFEEARELVDRATLLRLAQGRTVEALRYLDRGRASLAPVGAKPSPDTAGAVTVRQGEVAVVYALIADTLLAWTVAGERVELYRTPLDTTRLVQTIEQVRRRLEENAGEAELQGGLSRLYEWLVRPLSARLGAAETPLVVIADGDLGSIPFAGLYDVRRRRYLVEDHPLRSAASLLEARRPARRADPGAAPLFIADPAFDARTHPGFPRLPEAAVEAGEIAAGYPGARVLPDTAASREAVRAALRRAGLVHYAGHAVFDDERPERSYLLLAPAPGDATADILQAGEIAGMDLRHLSLVVLAACQTVRTGPGRAAGFSGLAGAFLAAGAGGAVGSLWEVDDRLTRPLMIELHRAYRATDDGPGALRAAQLRLLRSGDPALRSPAAWAGFRYAGS